MPSSGTLRRVTLVRIEASEELSASIIRVTRIGELGKTLAVTSNRRTLRRNISISYSSISYIVFLRNVLRLLVTANVLSSQILVTLVMAALRSSEKSFLTRTTRRNIPEDGYSSMTNISWI
jgi:hypothetical protein